MGQHTAPTQAHVVTRQVVADRVALPGDPHRSSLKAVYYLQQAGYKVLHMKVRYWY